MAIHVTYSADSAKQPSQRKAAYSMIDAKTGEVVATKKLQGLSGTVYTSVTSAGGVLYLGSERGALVLVKPGAEAEVVASSSPGKFRSSPVFEHGRMYLRTMSHLYCFGDRATE